MKTWLKIVIGVVVVLVVLVLALPAILSTAPVRRMVVKQANARQADVVLTVDDWSLGWRRGVAVRGVGFQDKQQRFGGTVESVTMSSGLLKLLAPRKDLGTIAVVAPHVWCDVSRLEASAKARPQPPSEKPVSKAPLPAGERVPLALDVTAKLDLKDAQLEVRRPGEPATTLSVNATVDCPSLKEAVAIALEGHCRVGQAAVAPGAAPDLKLNGSVRLLKDGVLDPAAMAADLVFQAKQFDLGTLALARAFLPSLPLINGRLDSDLTLKAEGTNALAITGETQVHALRLEGGALGTDRPTMDTLRLAVDLTRNAGALTIKQLSLKAPFATLKAAGELTPVAGAPYPRGQLSLIGNVDLAGLAAQFPATLKLPPATRITGGQFQVDGRVVSDEQAVRVQAKAGLRGLGGTQGDAAFQLAEPVDLALRAALTAQGPVLESFTLSSSFAKATGSGSSTGAVVQVEADLAVAAQEIDQIVDLGALRVGGRLRADVQVDLQAPPTKRIVVDAAIQGLALRGLSTRPGMESVPDLDANLQARATAVLGAADDVTIKAALQGTGISMQGGALGADRPQLDQLTLDFDAKRVGSQMVIRVFNLASPLAQANLSGKVETVAGAKLPKLDLQLHLGLNFVALAAQLPHLLKLQQDVRISDGTLQADAKLGADGEIVTWDAHAMIERLAAARGQQLLKLSAPIGLDLRGALAGAKIRLETASLRSGFAQLDAKGDAEAASLTVQANLDQAQAELGQFIDFGKFKMGGQLVAKAGMSSPTASERLINVDARVDKLLLAGLSPEPLRRDQVHLVQSGVIQFSPEWKVTGVRALQVAVNGLPLELKAQLARLALPDASAPTPMKIGDATIQAKGTLEELLAFSRAAGLLKRSDLPLKGPVSFDAQISSGADSVQIQSFDLVSPPLSVSAAGQLMDPTAQRRLQLKGSLASDCAEIALLTEAFAGYRPDMAGKAERDFSLDTELGAGDWQAILRKTEAKAGLHADHFKALGVQAADIDLAVSVHAARAQVVFDTQVNEGRLHAEPYLDLSGAQTFLSMPTNALLLSDVKLNEEMASQLLARIHPIFHGCAVMGGRLSLTLDDLHVPLGPRMQQETTFSGDMQLRNLVLGSGDGLLGKLLSALHVSAQEVQVSNQVVRFECRDGRITPSPLTFKVDRNKTIIVSGSVGLDQTLQYQAELPVTTNLLADLGMSQASPYLKETSVKVPIGGTVTSPRFDQQAFARALKELGTKAAKNAAIEQGGKLLGDFLKKRNAPAEGP